MHARVFLFILQLIAFISDRNNRSKWWRDRCGIKENPGSSYGSQRLQAQPLQIRSWIKLAAKAKSGDWWRKPQVTRSTHPVSVYEAERCRCKQPITCRRKWYQDNGCSCIGSWKSATYINITGCQVVNVTKLQQVDELALYCSNKNFSTKGLAYDTCPENVTFVQMLKCIRNST